MRYLMVLLVALLVSASSCDSSTTRAPEGLNVTVDSDTAEDVVIQLDEDGSGPITVNTITMENTTDETIIVTVPDPQKFSLEHSNGAPIAGGSELELAPGETFFIDIVYRGSTICSTDESGRASEQMQFGYYGTDDTSLGSTRTTANIAFVMDIDGVLATPDDVEIIHDAMVGSWHQTDITVMSVDVDFADDGSYEVKHNGTLIETGDWSLDGYMVTRQSAGGFTLSQYITTLGANSMNLDYCHDDGNVTRQSFSRL